MMNKIPSYLLYLLILLLYLVSDALAVPPEVILSERKKITPSLSENGAATMPSLDSFIKNNNLRRKIGSPFVATGEYTIVEGYITDLIDTPISDVVVRIWQANSFGKYLSEFVQNEYLSDDETYDKYFSYTGTTVTDNLGHYSFITIFPGVHGYRTPHINIFAQKENMFAVQTQIFFPDHKLNKKDKTYIKLTNSQKKLLTSSVSLINPNNPNDGKVVRFDIKVDMIQGYKSL